MSEADLIIRITATSATVGAVGVAGTMVVTGSFGGFDTGNDVRCDDIPTFDFL